MRRNAFSIDQAARHLRVHPNTVRRAVRGGRLAARLVRGRYVITREALESFRDGQSKSVPASRVAPLLNSARELQRAIEEVPHGS